MALTQVKTTGLADDAVTGAKIADDTVAEANMANDAISLAELKAGTDGQVITYDASGNPTAVGPGTDGQVLTSTGAGSPPAFEDLPASGATLSGSTDNTVVTVTGSNAMQGETNVRIDSSGRLLTGGQTTSVADASSLHADIQSHSADGNGLSLGRYAANAYEPYMTFFKSRNATIGSNGTIVQDGDSLGTINWYGATGSGWDHAAYHSVRVDGTPGASNDMPTEFIWNNQPDNQEHVAHTMSLRANGNLEVKTGNVVIGTAGKGIDFSATSDAGGMTSELLDDYEEGTHTPTITRTTSNQTATVNASAARYTKVGRLVHMWFHFDLSGMGTSGEGYWKMSLPFTTASDVQGWSIASSMQRVKFDGSERAGGDGQLKWVGTGNAAYLQLINTDVDGWHGNDGADLISTGYVAFYTA